MKVLKRILKWIGVCAGILVVIVFLLALATQTQFFKDRLRVILASSISTNINGTLHLGTIEGNFLTGFSVDSIAISDEFGIIFSSRKITCRYELLPLLERKIRINNFIIEQPNANLIWAMNGKWNIDRLIKPGEDTTKGTFDWTIQIDDFELKKGGVSLIDSASLFQSKHWDMPPSYFEYHNFSISDLTLKMSAVIRPRAIRVKIEHLNCYSPESRFDLINFKSDVSLSENEITANHTVIQTGKSYIEIDAAIKGINLFKGIRLEDMEHDSTNVRLKAKNLDLKELRSFLPQVNFLDGSVFATLTASGEFGNLQINQLNLEALGSKIIMTGNIRNLHQPEQLFLDVSTNNSKIVPSDVPRLLPGLPIPKFKEDQPFNLTTEFVGKPINFKTQTSLRGNSSEVELIGEMNLEPASPAYNVSFSTKRIDLSKYFDIENFPTSLTAHGTVSGQGFTLDDVASTLELTIDSSFVKKIELSNSKISLSASPHRLDGTGYLYSNTMKEYFEGYYDESKNTPEFGGTVELTSLDLAKVLADTEYRSDFNLRGRFSGTGRNSDDLNATIDISLLPSKFQNHELTSENISFVLDQSDMNDKRLMIESQIADAEFKGKFDIVKTNRMLADYISALAGAIKKHAESDSTISNQAGSAKLNNKPEKHPDINVEYHLKLKDLDPLSSFLGEIPFNTHAEINGRARSSNDRLWLTCDGTVDEFFVGTTRSGVLLNSGKITLQLDSLSEIDPLENLSGNFSANMNSGLLNKKKLEKISLAVTYDRLKGKVSGNTILDSLYKLNFTGDISVQPNTYVFDIDSLRFSAGNYTWDNNQDIQLRLNNSGLRVMHAEMKRNDEELTFNGALTSANEFDFNAEVKKFDLISLGILSDNPALSLKGQGFAGIANGTLHLTGSPASPVISLAAQTDETYFRETKIGKVIASVQYHDKNARIDLDIRQNAKDPDPILTLNGTIPVDLGFAGVEERFPERSQKLEIRSNGFNVNVLDPLLKDVDDLSGTLRCNLTLTGTPQFPRYHGSISLMDTKFLFIPNNISYILNTNLEAAGDHFKLRNLSIKNINEPGGSGETKVGGSLMIKNFKIDTFDLTAHGKFLLMSEATRKTSPSMYGLLFMETDTAGLNLRGTLERPYLSGKLFVREANLTFPPAKTNDIANTNLTLRYRLIDDTSKSVDTENKVSRYYAEADSFSEAISNYQFDSPIIDRLRYSIAIETRGPTALTMIFTPATGEELYAELDGKVNVINEQGTPNIYGEIEVSPQSYYNFFKRFDAKGNLKFVGPWNNPEMNIQATYEGYKQETSQQLTGQQSTSPATRDASQLMTEQKIIVNLNISGTRNEPRLDMSMKVQLEPNQEPTDWSKQTKGGDVQSDALSFIVTGKFRDELTSREQQEFTNVGSSTGSSVASSLLSGIFSDMLKREFPFIRRADVSYRGGNVQGGTSVNVTATAFKGYLRIGGRIFQDIGNTNVSYQLSLGDFFNVSAIRNLYLEIQRKVESENPDDKKLTNEARFFYRFSF